MALHIVTAKLTVTPVLLLDDNDGEPSQGAERFDEVNFYTFISTGTR